MNSNLDEKYIKMLVNECSKEELAKDVLKYQNIVCSRNVANEGVKNSLLYNTNDFIEKLENKKSIEEYNLLEYLREVRREINRLKTDWKE